MVGTCKIKNPTHVKIAAILTCSDKYVFSVINSEILIKIPCVDIMSKKKLPVISMCCLGSYDMFTLHESLRLELGK